MIELVYKKEGKDETYAVEKTEVTIGRSPEADLPIDSLAVSRFHAKLIREGGGLVIQDLDSRNGTKVNDVAVKRGPVRPGDRVTLGNFLLQLRSRIEQKVVLDEAADLPSTGDTILRSAGDVDRLLQGQPEAKDAAQRLETGELERSNRILRALMKAAQALISEDSLDGLLNAVMDLVFENVPAERGMLALYEGESLVPRVVRYRHDRSRQDTIVIPKAITAKVRSERVSILSSDAQKDFDGSRSVLSLGIHSAMCVPLWHKDRVIGIIYADEDRQHDKFGSDDVDLVTALASLAAVAIERQRLTERVIEEQGRRGKLERYHSPGVVERILSHGGGDRLEMQEHQVSVSFTDIVGFTTMSESLEPREVGMAINELFTELTECIFRHEGTLDKYIGDCIMAVFGAPVAQADHAVRCVRTALEMMAALERLNAERPERPPLRLRVGINSGEVVAGDFGSPKRKDYSVLGDAVNLASRLESQVSQPGWVVIGENTYSAVQELFECEPLGARTVKGKVREIAAYRVLREK